MSLFAGIQLADCFDCLNVVFEKLKAFGGGEREHPADEGQIYAVFGIIGEWCGEDGLGFVGQDTMVTCPRPLRFGRVQV